MFLLQEFSIKKGLTRNKKQWYGKIGAPANNSWNFKTGKATFTHEQILAAANLVGGNINWIYGVEDNMIRSVSEVTDPILQIREALTKIEKKIDKHESSET